MSELASLSSEKQEVSINKKVVDSDMAEGKVEDNGKVVKAKAVTDKKVVKEKKAAADDFDAEENVSTDDYVAEDAALSVADSSAPRRRSLRAHRPVEHLIPGTSI